MDIIERKEREEEFKKMSRKFEAEYWKIKINLNPVTTVASVVLVCIIVIWILCDDNSEAYAMDAQKWITKNFTWLYVASTMAWVIYLFVVYIQFGDMKLGLADEKPTHQNFAYYAMLLTCGISSPIFYAGVSDTIRHYNNENTAAGYYSKTTLAEKGQHAINLTVFMWGLHGYASYTVFGLIIGILTHRKGLPLTLRTCFYPLLGHYVFGPVGDFIDTVCISSILYGVSVSLVIGAQFLNHGFNVWNSDINTNKENQLYIIWCLTLLSTLSVVSGLNIGIKKLSQICFLLGSLICLILVTSYHTAHIFNVVVQSVGYYAQYLVGFGLYTAAFQQRGLTSTNEGEKDWMNYNTIFYWGWWISWSPFVGLFIAKISRGRTINEVIWYSFVLPTLTVFSWLITFGSIGLDIEMEAAMNKISCNETTVATETLLRLSCYSSYFQTYLMFSIFEDICEILRAITVIGAIFFFVTSSDSASLIIDCVSSNGEEDPPVLQRVLWALCEGVVASALLEHTQDNGSLGLQAFVVMTGFPLTFLLSFCCYSLWRVLKNEPNWKIELEKVWENVFPREINEEMIKKCLTAVFAPWYVLGKISIKVREVNEIQKAVDFIFPAFLFNFWIILLFLSIGFENMDKIGWSLLIIFMCYGGNCRQKVRSKFQIEGNIFCDVMTMVLYPITIMQMEKQMKKEVNETEIALPITVTEMVNPDVVNRNDIEYKTEHTADDVFHANENESSVSGSYYNYGRDKSA